MIFFGLVFVVVGFKVWIVYEIVKLLCYYFDLGKYCKDVVKNIIFFILLVNLFFVL